MFCIYIKFSVDLSWSYTVFLSPDTLKLSLSVSKNVNTFPSSYITFPLYFKNYYHYDCNKVIYTVYLYVKINCLIYFDIRNQTFSPLSKPIYKVKFTHKVTRLLIIINNLKVLKFLFMLYTEIMYFNLKIFIVFHFSIHLFLYVTPFYGIQLYNVS